MNVKRLLRLADYLHSVPAEAFDMECWASRGACGTTACAMGHACSVPEFAAAGLSLDWDSEPGDGPDAYAEAVPRYRAGGANYPGFHAAEVFFGVTYAMARDLFDPERYVVDVFRPADDVEGDEPPASGVTPRDVADRIRELVATHTAAKEN